VITLHDSEYFIGDKLGRVGRGVDEGCDLDVAEGDAMVRVDKKPLLHVVEAGVIEEKHTRDIVGFCGRS
jgi:hypothetical protein